MTTKLSISNLSGKALSALDGPKVISIQITDSNYNAIDDTAVDINGGYAVITGTGFNTINYTIGGATYVSSPQVLLDNTPVNTVTFVSDTTLRVRLPAAAAKSYSIQIINPDGRLAILPAALTYSPSPIWQTSSTLTSVEGLASINIQLSANEATNSAIIYSLAAANTVPTGMVLFSNGLFRGNVITNANATYNFTVQATDTENQDAYRTFTLPVTLNTPPAWLGTQPANLFYAFVAANVISPPVLYSNTIVATDPAIASYTITSGSLPPGISLNSNTGVISGNASISNLSNTYSFTVRATDTVGFTADKTFNLAISNQLNTTTLLVKTNPNTTSANTLTIFDSSANNYPITRYGTFQTTFSPFSQAQGRWSNYFAGNSSKLTTSTSSNFAWGTGDFTVECWFYNNTAMVSGGTIIAGTAAAGGGVFYGTNTTGISWNVFGVGNTASQTAQLALNLWYHIAYSRQSGTGRLFVNGALVSSAADTTNYTATTFYVGGGSSTQFVTGFISNVRSVKDTAVYTTAFIPPGLPLGVTQSANVNGTPSSAITGANTALLTCQSNRFIDASNTVTISTSITPEVQTFSPLPPEYELLPIIIGGSQRFDGISTALGGPSTAFNPFCTGSTTGISMTLEAFVYPTATVAGASAWQSAPIYSKGQVYFVFGIYNNKIRLYWYDGVARSADSTDSIPLNAWSQVSVTVSDSLITFYINGVASGTGTFTGIQAAGVNTTEFFGYQGNSGSTSYFKGFISSIRISNTIRTIRPQTTFFTSDINTIYLLNFNETGIYEGTTNGYLGQTAGVSASSVQSKWGKSIDLQGAGVYITTANVITGVNTVSGGEFTFECWYYSRDVNRYHHFWCNTGSGYGTANRWVGIVPAANSPNGTGFGLGAFTQGYTGVGGYLTGQVPAANTWVHLALSRDSTGTTRCWINGTYYPTTRYQTSWLGNNFGPSLNDGYYLTGGLIGYIPNGGPGQGGAQFGETTGFIEDIKISNKALYTTNVNIRVPSFSYPALP